MLVCEETVIRTLLWSQRSYITPHSLLFSLTGEVPLPSHQVGSSMSYRTQNFSHAPLSDQWLGPSSSASPLWQSWCAASVERNSHLPWFPCRQDRHGSGQMREVTCKLPEQFSIDISCSDWSRSLNITEITHLLQIGCRVKNRQCISFFSHFSARHNLEVCLTFGVNCFSDCPIL